MKVFDFLDAINYTKEQISNEDIESTYAPFIINKSLSYYLDSIFFADKANTFYNLPKKMQFDYLLNVIPVRKNKRWAKWDKPDDISYNIRIIKEYYNYSDEKAKQVIDLLSPEQIGILEQRLFKGGI